jgi:hypothetical protein
MAPAVVTERRRGRSGGPVPMFSVWLRTGVLAGVVTALALTVAAPSAAFAQSDAPDASTTAEQELADRYAPVIMVKEQLEQCAEGEAYLPTSVDIVLDNPQILLRQVGANDPVMMRGPAVADLFELGEGFYLDFPGQALDPGCLYQRDFDNYRRGTEPTVYAHVARQEDRPDELALQYWFYWYYNDWNNKHESDWEGIQLLFDVGTVEEALATEPVSVGYAQHEGGERGGWNSSKLERDGTRPVVYSSVGSHASYFGSALYIGRSASEGFGCDNTDGPSTRLDPEVVVLPDHVDDPNDPLAWLSFDGRWGERHSGPYNGPTGPADKDRWTDPISWHDDLRASSAVVPTGDSQADGVISAFCGVVEWGSGQFITLKSSPVRFLATVAVVVLLALWVVRRTVWNRTDLQPLVRRRRAGQILRTAASGYRRRPAAMITFGLVYLPLTLAAAAIGAAASALPVFGTVIDLARDVSEATVVVALFVGGLTSVVAYVAVNAMVAAFLVQPAEGDGERDVLAAIRFAWSRRWPLAVAFARSVLVVVPLALTLIGLPWAVRQLIRYQFLPQAVVVEGADGRSALARSTILVRGRWWYTALMIAVFNAMITLSGMVIGLLLLLVLRSAPFWLFSALITLVYALIVPLAALAHTLLYGDAAAARADDVTVGAEPDDPAPAAMVGATSDAAGDPN